MTRLKLYLVMLALMFSPLVHAQKNVLRKSVYFESGKFELTAESKTILSHLADSLKKFTSFTIAIRGNTDDVGDSLYNKKLSEQRVETVKNFLTEQGVKPESFKIWALGETKPLADNTTEEGKRQNRRVDLAVTFIKRVEPAKVAVVRDTLPSIQELYRKLAVPPEEFCINPVRDTMIICRNGTLLNIRAGSFKLMPTCSNQCVTLRVKENFSKSDMIFDNLTTTSNGRIIESMGMMHTEAVDCKGKKTDLLRDKDILVIMPTDTLIPSAKLFFGTRNAHDSLINWQTMDKASLLGFTSAQLDSCHQSRTGGIGLKKCPVFFCKVRKALKKIFGNKSEAKPGTRGGVLLPGLCENIDALMKKYGVQNQDALLDTLQKIREQIIRKNISNNTATDNEIKYFVFNLPKMGWVNVDAFANYDPADLTTMSVQLEARSNTDCRLVFKNKKIVLSPFANGTFQFNGVPKGETAWLVALKYEGGEAFLYIKEVTIANQVFEVELKKVSIDELKELMLQLNQ